MRSPILKERLFGLSGPEGNHGEDVKEYYYYLDSTPTHSWMRACYKYPQAAYPYADLVAENRRRGKGDPEYELIDTGVFAEDRYFDVFVVYAKTSPDDILIEIRAVNRGPAPAELHLMPTLWFRNTWSWRNAELSMQHAELPRMRALDAASIFAEHPTLGNYVLHCEPQPSAFSLQPLQLLFTENESNNERLWGVPSASPYVKDAFHRFVIAGETDAVNPAQTGTKAAAWYQRTLAPGEEWAIHLRLRRLDQALPEQGNGQGLRDVLHAPFSMRHSTLTQREVEADAFYAALQPAGLNADDRNIQRQAFAGMLWSKQFYSYDVDQWLRGDPALPPPPPKRRHGRNREWLHFNSADILSMPDTWEYPWFAASDTAFHCLPLALLNAEFAKQQLVLLSREWFQHPNGQVPAYEWAFGDVNPPVLAWAA